MANLPLLIGQTYVRVPCPNMSLVNIETKIVEGCSSPVSKGSTWVLLILINSGLGFIGDSNECGTIGHVHFAVLVLL